MELQLFQARGEDGTVMGKTAQPLKEDPEDLLNKLVCDWLWREN
jgi:hypothetical protein